MRKTNETNRANELWWPFCWVNHQPHQHITWMEPKMVSSEQHSSALQRASGWVCPQGTGLVFLMRNLTEEYRLRAMRPTCKNRIKLSVPLRVSCFIIRGSAAEMEENLATTQHAA